DFPTAPARARERHLRRPRDLPFHVFVHPLKQGLQIPVKKRFVQAADDLKIRECNRLGRRTRIVPPKHCGHLAGKRRRGGHAHGRLPYTLGNRRRSAPSYTIISTGWVDPSRRAEPANGVPLPSALPPLTTTPQMDRASTPSWPTDSRLIFRDCPKSGRN